MSSEFKTPDKCPGCALSRSEYIEWYRKYWGDETNQAGAGVAWAWHCKKHNEKDCTSVAAFLQKAKEGLTVHTDPDADDYYKSKYQKKGKMRRDRTPSSEPQRNKKPRKEEKDKEKPEEEEEEPKEKEKEKEKDLEKDLDIEDLATLMSTDPGEACRRMIGNTFTPVIGEVMTTLKSKEKDLEKELHETRSKMHKIKTSADAFTRHMVEGCKQISAVKIELDQLSAKE